MKRVLWVEDDERIRNTAERLCHFFGVKVGFCNTYLEAESVLAYGIPRDRYLAIVSDMDLGKGPTGADVLAAAERAGIPVRVLFSGGAHGPGDAPAATAILSKAAMRHLVEQVLKPLFEEGA
jgi:hypothetical protein